MERQITKGHMDDFGVYALITRPLKSFPVSTPPPFMVLYPVSGSRTFQAQVHVWLDLLDEESKTETQIKHRLPVSLCP